MATTQARSFVEQTMSDRTLADKFRDDPMSILDEYDLESEEEEALRSMDDDEMNKIVAEAKADWAVSIVVVVT